MAVTDRAVVMARVAPLRRIRELPIAGALPVVLIVAAAFGIAAVWARSIHTFSVMPDELGYLKQSLEIARSGLLVGPHNFWFNSWGQLLPLISAPLFGGLGMVDAYYASHTLYALLLASTAIPVYLLAKELGLGRLAGYLVAALSVAVPWLVYAGLIMTEVVAYPAFAWAVLAMTRAVHAPSARRDLLAILALGIAFLARTQLVVLAPILLVVVLIHDLTFGLSGRIGGRKLATALRGSLVNHRVLWAAAAMAGLGAAVAAISGKGSDLFGSYITPLHAALIPAGAISAGLRQLDGIAIAVGIVPLILCMAWVLTTVVRPKAKATHAFATLVLVLLPVLVVMLGSFVVNYLAFSTTDRYMFYIEPLLFLGTAAWIVERRGSLIALLVAGAAVALMVLRVDGLHYETVFTIVNPDFPFDRVLVGQSYRVSHALGFAHADTRAVLAIVTTILALGAFLARRWLRTWQALLVIMLPLLAYGVITTAYAMRKIAPQFASIPASHPQTLPWVDRTVSASARAGIVIAPLGVAALDNPSDTWFLWWQTTFWNKSVRKAFVFPGDDPFAQGFVATIHQDLRHGRLTGVNGVDYLIKLSQDARFAPRAATVGPSSELQLYRLEPGAPLLYGTSGLTQYGWVDRNAFLRVFAAPGATSPERERVTVTVQTLAAQAGCPCRLNLGPPFAAVTLPPATPSGSVKPLTRISHVVTVPPSGFVQLNLGARPRRGEPKVSFIGLTSVSVTPLHG